MATLLHQEIEKSHIDYAQGAFDTKIDAKYDEKEYPQSKAKYSELYLSKPLENGSSLLAGYRKAEGIQEYNNIKTGSQGEFQVGVKLPLVDLMQGANEKKLAVKLSKLSSQEAHWQVTQELREFYFRLLQSYYQLLLSGEILKLNKELLQNAKTRSHFIEKRVQQGDLAPIIALEAKQLIYEREQRKAQSQNTLNTAQQNFLELCNKDESIFEIYSLPPLQVPKIQNRSYETLLKKMMQTRPTLHKFELQKEKLQEQSQFTKRLQYPRVDAALYGVHDNSYNDNGFKLTLDFSLPLERRQYEGKARALQLKEEQNNHELRKEILHVQKLTSTLLYAIKTLEKNIQSVNEEIALTQKLQQAEERKFELGKSDLFMINQRELQTLQAKEKKIKYITDLCITLLDLEKETGEILEATF